MRTAFPLTHAEESPLSHPTKERRRVLPVKAWRSSSRRLQARAATSQSARRGRRLARGRAAQAEERLSLGDAWDDHDLVFPNGTGRPLNPSNLLSRSHRALLDRAGLPRIRFHDLRPTAVTLMLGRGVYPKVVSEMLGHSTATITLYLYSHVTPTMQQYAQRPAPVAQGIERRFPKPCVAGSNPAGGATVTAGQPRVPCHRELPPRRSCRHHAARHSEIRRRDGCRDVPL